MSQVVTRYVTMISQADFGGKNIHQNELQARAHRSTSVWGLRDQKGSMWLRGSGDWGAALRERARGLGSLLPC